MSDQFASHGLLLDVLDEYQLPAFDFASDDVPTDIFDPASLPWQSFEYDVKDTFCTCLNDLQICLKTELDQKVSATRADRLVLACNMAPLAQLSLQRLENDGDDQLCADLSLQQSNIELHNVEEVVCGEDIALKQKACEVLVQAIAQIDSSAWVQVNACYQSETVACTYICSNSKEHWKNCNGPEGSLSLVACSSKRSGGLTASRPAFDCQGSLTISFLEPTKEIRITYAHIPLHRTVSQLSDKYNTTPPSTPVRQPETKTRSKTKKRTSTKKAKKQPEVDLDQLVLRLADEAFWDTETLQAEPEEPKKKRRVATMSKLICFTCKEDNPKVRCSRMLPSCGNCELKGWPCEYPKSKYRSKKSIAAEESLLLQTLDPPDRGYSPQPFL